MKTKIITFLMALGLVLTGCGSNGGTPGGVSPEPIPEGDVFFTAKNKLYEHHNYTVKVTTTVAEDEQSPYVDRFYNINNKAYYSVNSEYPLFYSGIIYQKNQGYVGFDLVINGDEVVPNNFYSTDAHKSVSDIYTYAIERVLNGTFMKEGDKYSCSEVDPIAVMVGLSGFDTTYISAPNKIYATVVNEQLVITSDFTLWYIDPSTVEKVVQDGKVTVEFENINSTHNTAIEAYIDNPSTVFIPQEEWSNENKEKFNSYFNERIPPFPTGVSYSFKVGEYYDGYAQEKYAIAEDYVCGDISSSYGETLRENGFTKVDDYHYVIEQIVSSGSMKETYYVDMVFTGPNEVYSGNRTVGYYFPNGVFTIKYRYKIKPTEDINSIAKLNTHIFKSKARTILPAFPDNGEIDRITNFEDRTAYANQYYSPEERAYLFVTSVSSLIVKLHASKANALLFVDRLETALATKGFNKNSDTRYGQISFVDEKQSKVVITDPNYQGNTQEGIVYNYPGYMQLQIVIYNAYGEIIDPSEVLDKIVVTNQTVDYHVGDTFKFDGIVTAEYQSGDTKVVTPSSVTTPDMTTAGDKIVTVTYIEDGQKKTTGYTIHVTYPDSPTAKTILYASGFNHEAVAHIDLENSVLPNRAEPGSLVTMTVAVEDGYKFECFYPNDEPGDVWEQFYDEPKRTKTVTFTMPDYSFEMILITKLDDGSPDPIYPVRMELSGYTTTYHEYDEFSFDGTCTIVYEDGHSSTVTPIVKNYPNMTQLGKQEVVLEYTENYVTVRASYEITVTERPVTPKYQINKATFEGGNIANLKVNGSAKSEAEEGDRVTFNVSVNSGYTLNKVYYEYNGNKTYITPGLSGAYSFLMPAADVTIGAEITAPTIMQKLDGTFAFQVDDHNIYEFNFNASNRTGTYTRTRSNSGGEDVWSVNFTYSYSAGKVTLTLVDFASGSDNTSFAVGYRLFASGTKGATNTSLSINEEGNTITLSLFKSSSTTDTESHSFYKD